MVDHYKHRYKVMLLKMGTVVAVAHHYDDDEENHGYPPWN